MFAWHFTMFRADKSVSCRQLAEPRPSAWQLWPTLKTTLSSVVDNGKKREQNAALGIYIIEKKRIS